jgi:hypothetical protein
MLAGSTARAGSRRAEDREGGAVWRTEEGSTGRLIQLCLGYFLFYVVTGVAVKYFLRGEELGFPGMNGVEYLVHSTFGSAGVVLIVVLARGWFRIDSIRPVRVGRLAFPGEWLYILPSGVCTAVVIPTTTLMYTLPISILVAMVIMRGSVIVISRAVDAVQIRQGLLDKRVYAEENLAVVFAVAAVSVHVLFAADGGFDFLRSPAAVAILSSYVVAYSVRIYIMNYYKNTHARVNRQDNKAFFGVEQLAASVTLVTAGLLVYHSPALFGWSSAAIDLYRDSFRDPHPAWKAAAVSGTAFGAVAFFSVFLFLFHGRTATFAGLVNRLTSLVAGTAATLLFHYAFGGSFPSARDWISLGLILVAILFLTRAERKRVAELRGGPPPAAGGRPPAPAPGGAPRVP